MSGHEFDTQMIFRLILGMVFIFGLLIFGVWLLRKTGVSNYVQKARNKNKRATIVEAMQVDPKRRLVMVRRDNVEHLLLLGPNNDLLIEGNIPDQEAVFEQALKKASTESKE